MTISVLTFNTNNNKISIRDIKLMKGKLTENLIFFAFQEIYQPFSKPTDLFKKITSIFTNYEIVAYKRLFGLVSILIQKKDINSSNNEIEVFRMGLGPLYLGFKGFICIRYNNTILINAHLPAHEQENHKRIKMIHDIFSIIEFKFGKNRLYENINTIILAGDLNFRLIEKDVSNKISKGIIKDFFNLFPYDQINTFKKLYPAFIEGNIEFKPTYKYNLNSSSYSTKRFMSYCDRIFVASHFRTSVMFYKSIDNITMSDHRPVVSKIEITDEIVEIKPLFKSYNNELSLFRIKYYISETYAKIYDSMNMCIIVLAIILIFYFFRKFILSK